MSLNKKNKANPPKGRKPILSKANRAKIAASNAGIRTVLSRVAGAGLTAAAKAVIGSVFGQGDYTVKYNSLTGVGGPPQFSSNGNSRSTIISHREFVKDITGTTAFNIQTFALTPTNSTLFPWLAQVASNYEEYRIHGMLFEFKTTSGMSVSSTNTALGTVIMATQYNPNDVAFTTKIEMENYEFATSGGPFENFLHALECKPQLTVAPQLYVNQPNSSGAVVDLRLTNFGQFNIATVGMQASNVVGELWVSYMVELLKPRLTSLTVGNGGIRARFNSGCSGTNVFGTNGVIVNRIDSELATNGERSYWINDQLTARYSSTSDLVNTPYPSGLNFAVGGILTLPNVPLVGHTLRVDSILNGTGLGTALVFTQTAGGPAFTVIGVQGSERSADVTVLGTTTLIQFTSQGDRTIQLGVTATTVGSHTFDIIFVD